MSTATLRLSEQRVDLAEEADFRKQQRRVREGRARVLLAEGLTTAEVAERMGVARRWVERVASGGGARAA